MAEYIEREAAYEKCGWYNTVNGKSVCAVRKDELASIPAADVAPVVRGRWIPYHEADIGWDEYGVKCSVCNFEVESLNIRLVCNHYCPNCGAHMKDGE